MTPTRRDLALLLPALYAANASGEAPVLPSKTYSHEALPVKTNGGNQSRAVLNGATHSGFPIEAHETELAPGSEPHPPHHHVHEEMLYIRQGTLEVTILGKSVKLGPGSVAYVASNEEHGWRNVGTDRAAYIVLAFGPKA